MRNLLALLAFLGFLSCKNEAPAPAVQPATPTKGSFGYDLDFLRKHHPDLVLLSDEGGQAQVIVLPAYQGRVMTSTAAGGEGASFGWVNPLSENAFSCSNNHRPALQSNVECWVKS